MSGRLLHLILETPGCNSYELLKEATMEDSPLPIFYLPREAEVDGKQERHWKKDENSQIFELSLHGEDQADECFLFLSHKIDLADQIEATIELFNQTDNFSMGRVLFFIHAPLLLEPPEKLIDWIDAGAHFSDAMLFTGRNNENSSCIKTVQDRYYNMRYPMESFILGKKNTPWARILDPTPRRLSHVFDSGELLDSEELPECDRYLEKLPSGIRARIIPNPFSS